MKLIEKKLSKKLSNYHEIGEFMKRVFPKDERMPMWLIRVLIHKKNYQCNVYYDQNVFVGIVFTIESDDTVFVFYLAVNDAIHSRGYGSELLQVLFEKYPEKSVTLFIETMDDKEADNYEQRVKRLAFYERNGFSQTGFQAGGKKPVVDILSRDKSYTIDQAKKLMKWIPMKLFESDTEQKKKKKKK